MSLAAAPIAELQAPASWQRLDFISDLHLHAEEPRTFEHWEKYMANTSAHAIFILGDLFDVWIGDDAIAADFSSAIHPGFEDRCARILQATSQRSAIYFMHGNRDFLLGAQAAQGCGLRLLADPSVLVFQDQRYLLTHGDALCLADTAYQKFRLEVRSAAWQQVFLAKPLQERKVIAKAMRAQSEQQKKIALSFADVDGPTACQWLAQANAGVMIHGHTHRPGDQSWAPAQRRHVLSDWDATATPQRLEVMRLSKSKTNSAPELRRLSITESC